MKKFSEIGDGTRRLDLADGLRGLTLYPLDQGDRDLVREGHIEFAGDEGEDSGRAVGDNRVFDAVET